METLAAVFATMPILLSNAIMERGTVLFGFFRGRQRDSLPNNTAALGSLSLADRAMSNLPMSSRDRWDLVCSSLDRLRELERVAPPSAPKVHHPMGSVRSASSFRISSSTRLSVVLPEETTTQSVRSIFAEPSDKTLEEPSTKAISSSLRMALASHKAKGIQGP